MSGLLITVFSYSVWLISCMPDTTYSLLLLSAFLYWKYNIYKLDDVLNWSLMKQNIPLHSNGFCTGMVCLSTSWAFFPPTEWLVAKLDLPLWRLLSLKAYLCFRLFALFHSSRKLMPDCFFLFLSSLPFLPSQSLTILLSCSPVSVQLSYSLASSGKVMKRHIMLLSGCTVSS